MPPVAKRHQCRTSGAIIELPVRVCDDLRVKCIRPIILIAVSLALTYLYLYPGSQAWLENRPDTVMSDGTDATTVPYIWDQLRQEWRQHPTRFLYGTVWTNTFDPERGYPIWVSWIERPIGLVMVYAGSVEQASTGIVIGLLLFSVLCMYGLGRYLDWNPWLSFALALAWAFCAYTRARAQVHTGFVGVYFIPLLFLGLLLAVRGKTRRTLFSAAAALLVAVMAPHYYVVTAAFLSPFFLLYVWLQPETQEDKLGVVKRVALATLPAILFLAFNLKFATPPEARVSSREALPQTGETFDGQLHPFLRIYAARPIDYFTSDLGLSQAFQDINPLKTLVNENVYKSLVQDGANGNTHERTNGIRWLLWLLAAAALLSAARGRRAKERKFILYFTGLALFTFWLSLSPDTLGFGPSAWLYKLVSQIRVSSRAGIWVHFSVLMIVGTWLSSSLAPTKLKQVLTVPLVFAALIVIEYPPLWQTVRMAPIEPAYTSLSRDKGACGAGLYFPFASNNYASIPYYHFLQRMRGSDCTHLNSFADFAHIAFITRLFPPTESFLNRLAADLVTPMRLERLAACVPLNFIVFDPSITGSVAGDYCRSLGWSMTEPGVCVSPKKGEAFAKFPEQCGL